MGRSRKEDRQSRKRTKLALDQTRSSGPKSNGASFAPPVFAKGQFTSLANKGKARQPGQPAPLNGHGNARAHHGNDGMDEEELHPSLPAARVSNANLNRHGIHSVDHSAVDLAQDGPSSSAALGSAWSDFDTKVRLDDTLTGRRDSSIKAYMKELRKVVENADVLLEVLDARDPMGCRSLETERMLMRAGKKVVLILNKIDLVPKSNVEAWLRYLRHDFPTLAFKASTQSQRSNLSQGASAFYAGGKTSGSSSSNGGGSGSKDVITGGAEAMGAGALLQLIKNYSRNLNLKTSITVGIFGAPNVGKSSLINSLKRARVCSVASTPGHTKVVQGVMLDKSVRLLDCPGIVFSDESGGSAAAGLSAEEVIMRKQSALLRNVVKVELVEDPVAPVEAIMARVEDRELAEVYGLEYFQPGDAQDFLMRIAIQRGRMLRGGKIDLDGTARSVLHDWNVGRIKYFTQPPALHRSAILSTAHGAKTMPVSISNDNMAADEDETDKTNRQLAESTTIVSGFGEAFDLAGLLGEADAEIFGGTQSGLSANVAEPPQARYATAQDDEPSPDLAAEATVEDEQEAQDIVDDHEARADLSNVSTLGKRRRAFDDDGLDNEDESDSDEDDQEEDAEGGGLRRRRPVARRTAPSNVPGLTAVDDDDEDDNIGDDEADVGKGVETSAALAQSATGTLSAPFTFQSGQLDAATSQGSPAWLERQQAKATLLPSRSKRHAELSSTFSSQELESLAASRGLQNRKLKKMKKKAERAGAGLVGALEAGMDLGTVVSGGAGRVDDGFAGKESARNGKVQSGRFAALMQEDEEVDEEGDEHREDGTGRDGDDSPAVVEKEEEMGSAVATASVVGHGAVIEEDEEEL